MNPQQSMLLGIEFMVYILKRQVLVWRDILSIPSQTHLINKIQWFYERILDTIFSYRQVSNSKSAHILQVIYKLVWDYLQYPPVCEI